MLLRAELPDHIFNNYDRAVDDEHLKSIAPRLIRFPEMTFCVIPAIAKRSAERDRRRDNQRSAPVSQEQQQPCGDEQRALEQIRSSTVRIVLCN